MLGQLLLVAEHAVSMLRGSDAWEKIAADAGLALPIEPSAIYDDAILPGIAGGLAESMSTDAPTAMRAIGEHGFPVVIAAVGEDTLPRQIDEFFGALNESVHAGISREHPGSQPPLFVWTREGRRRQLTYRSPRGLADLAEGLLMGALQWLGVRAAVSRQDLGPELTRFEVQVD